MSCRRPIAAVAAGLCSLALGACVVGPDYSKPTAPETTAFRGAPAIAARAVDTPVTNAAWWTGFKDPEMIRLVDRALAQNLDLAQAQARLLQARAQAEAAHAALAPVGRLDAQGQFQHQSLKSPLGQIESSFPGYNRNQGLYDLGASASWEADLFGGLRRASQASRARYEQSEAALAGARLAVEAETADAYVLVRALQARLAVARDEAATRRQLLELAQLLRRQGVAATMDEDEARGGLAQAEAAVPVLDAALEAQMNRLEVLVGAQPGDLHAELAPAAAVPAPPGIDASGGPAALVRRRPDIIAAERNLAAADAGVGAAIADYYPKITFSGVLGFESGNIGDLGAASAFGAAFQPQGLVGLQWRLFDFGRIDAEVAAAKGARAEALAAYRLCVLNATADVETALVSLVRREAQARSLVEGETSLARARDSTEASYRAGRSSLIDVLDADDRLLATRDQVVQARTEAARAAIASFKALGGGWSS